MSVVKFSYVGVVGSAVYNNVILEHAVHNAVHNAPILILNSKYTEG